MAIEVDEVLDVARRHRLGWMRRYPKLRHMGEDIQQEAAVAAVEAAKEYVPGGAKFHTFAYRRMFTAVRKLVKGEGSQEDGVEVVGATGADHATARAVVGEVLAAIEGLPQLDQDVVLRGAMEYEPARNTPDPWQATFAATVGLTPNALRSRLTRARAGLRGVGAGLRLSYGTALDWSPRIG